MPLHVLGIEQAHPRREPLWLIEFDLLDDSLLGYQEQKPESPTVDWPVLFVEPSPLPPVLHPRQSSWLFKQQIWTDCLDLARSGTDISAAFSSFPTSETF